MSVAAPCTIGLAVVALSLWPFGHLASTTSLWSVALWLFVGGLGVGLGMMPNTVVGMNSVPGRYVAQASAVRSLNRQLAGAFGIAVLASLLTARIGTVGVVAREASPRLIAGYNVLFDVAMWTIVCAMLLSLLLPGRTGSLELQERRRHDQGFDSPHGGPDGESIGVRPGFGSVIDA